MQYWQNYSYMAHQNIPTECTKVEHKSVSKAKAKREDGDNRVLIMYGLLYTQYSWRWTCKIKKHMFMLYKSEKHQKLTKIFSIPKDT